MKIELADQPTDLKPTTAINALAVGDRAVQAVSRCLEAADHIDGMLSQVEDVAAEIRKMGNLLADDFRSRAATLQSTVERFAALSEASAERMSAERDHLSSLKG